MSVSTKLADAIQPPTFLHPSSTIRSVLGVFFKEEGRAFIVSGDGLTVAGILSEHDLAEGLYEHGSEMLDMKVEALMTQDVITCSKSDRVIGLMGLMDQHQIRHIPIVEGDHFVGIVSIQDLIKLRLSEVQDEAEALREYIVHG